MTLDAQAILDSWSAPIGVNVSLFLAVLIYTKGWLHLRKTFPNLISSWRLAAYLAGIFSVWVTVGTPLDAFDDVSLSVHMVQHLLLMAIAPPLILLGAPALPLLQGIPQSMARGVLGPFLRWSLVKRFARFIFNPAVCWLAAALALMGWHIPAVFELALRSRSWHELEHATFFVTGLLFWWPVIQPWPSTARWARWSIPLYLFCATLPCDALSGFLTFCDRVVYTSYLSAPHILTASPLQDQEWAAALMWVSVTIIFLVPAVVVTIQILSPGSANLPAQPWPALNRIAGQPLDPSKPEII
jgi:cytochrome c oxidase assembly factor CtaG